MPTTRGWAAIGVAAALVGLWAAFGETELLTTAVFLLAAVLLGLAFVRFVTPGLELTRRLHPSRVHEGDDAIVELAVSATRTVRNLALEDVVHGLGVAKFAAARTEPGSPLLARYEVLCRSRGAYDVGPAEVAVSDAFALAERRSVAGRVDRLLVYPRVEVLHGFPAVRGHDPALQSTRPTFAPHGGEDFFTLREYQIGDDLRKVHWRSSAKRDELMIKQLEIPWQARGVVVLDQRTGPYATPDAFEQAVRGAASVITHLYRNGFSPELWTGDRTPVLRSADLYTQALDVLATVQPLEALDLYRTVVRLRRRSAGGGALVLISGHPDDGVLAAYRALAKDFSHTIVMTTADPIPTRLEPLQRAGAVTVAVGTADRWAPAWRAAMEASWSTASAG